MNRKNPDLIDELYHKQRKRFPEELLFPERFNLKLTKESFEKGVIRRLKKDVKKYVNWKGEPIREEPITVIGYECNSRLDCAIKESFPRSFQPYSHVYSEHYNNIQIGSANRVLDLEYNLFLYPSSDLIKTILVSFDTEGKYRFHSSYALQGSNLKVRIQYAQRIVNSAGPRWDLHGYIYKLQRRETC